MQATLIILSNEDRELIEAVRQELLDNRKQIPDVLISGNEVARLLGLNPGYVCRLVSQKKLNRVTIGASRGFPLKEVLKYKTRREAIEP